MSRERGAWKNSAEEIVERSLLVCQISPEVSVWNNALEVKYQCETVYSPVGLICTSLCCSIIKHQTAKRLLHWFTLEDRLQSL